MVRRQLSLGQTSQCKQQQHSRFGGYEFLIGQEEMSAVPPQPVAASQIAGDPDRLSALPESNIVAKFLYFQTGKCNKGLRFQPPLAACSAGFRPLATSLFCERLEIHWRFAVDHLPARFSSGPYLQDFQMINGTVKFFNTTKGFGFISPEGGDKDAFVHISAVERSGLNGLYENDKVTYELETGRDGKVSATNLTLV